MAPSSSSRRTRLRRAVPTIVVGASATLLVACNALLGISDYERGECSGGGICADAGFAPETSVSDVTQERADSGFDASRGTQPVSWAKFPMPNYAEDGGPNVNVVAYEEQGERVKDRVSGLVWQKSPAGDTVTWDDALKACSGSWRLPSRIELVTLLDLSTPGTQAKFSSPFTGPAASYWTFSEVREVRAQVVTPTGDIWAVDFAEGGVKKLSPATRLAVRCIARDGQ